MIVYDVYFTHCFIPTLGGRHRIWHYLTFFWSKKHLAKTDQMQVGDPSPQNPNREAKSWWSYPPLGPRRSCGKKVSGLVGWWWMMDIAILMILIVFNKWFMSWRSFFKKKFMTFQVLVDSEVEYNTDRFAWRVFMRTSPVLRWNLGQNTAAFWGNQWPELHQGCGLVTATPFNNRGWVPLWAGWINGSCFFKNLVVGSFGRRYWYIHECWESLPGMIYSGIDIWWCGSRVSQLQPRGIRMAIVCEWTFHGSAHTQKRR